MVPPGSAPEELARKKIDAALIESGWIVQDREEMNLFAGRGLAVDLRSALEQIEEILGDMEERAGG